MFHRRTDGLTDRTTDILRHMTFTPRSVDSCVDTHVNTYQIVMMTLMFMPRGLLTLSGKKAKELQFTDGLTKKQK